MAFLGLCLEPGAGQSSQKWNMRRALGDQPQKVSLRGQQPLVQVPGACVRRCGSTVDTFLQCFLAQRGS